jgi:hypothetical protein
MQDLRNESYIKTLVENLGGAQALVNGIREYRQIVARMWSERASLMEKYPDRWIAMGKDGVLAVGDSMDDVLEEVESQGYRGSEVVIEFLDTDPPLLIL